jgi:phage replication initiation protein
MNTDWIENIKEKRLAYGLTQNKLAIAAGISRQYYNDIETGKVIPSDEKKKAILEALERFNPDNPLEMMIDYVRIRFPTTDVEKIFKNLLRLKKQYFIEEDFGFYSYECHYHLGDILVLASHDLEKGILLELKGKGCRQFETYLHAQNRSWFEFFMDCLIHKAVIKRLDLAINDKAGLLNIPLLTEKCQKEECVSVFRSFKSYRSGELKKRHEKEGMGNTLYIGSLKSDIYFCIYQKDYEQLMKNDISLEDTEVKNRFEIRLKNERADYALKDLLKHEDPEQTAFKIINRYIRFVEPEDNKPRTEWKLTPEWEWFIGKHRSSMTLTTKPEPYTLERTIRWLSHQVAPSWKVISKLDELNHTSYIKEILKHAKLKEKHAEIIKQHVISVEDIIL